MFEHPFRPDPNSAAAKIIDGLETKVSFWRRMALGALAIIALVPLCYGLTRLPRHHAANVTPTENISTTPDASFTVTSTVSTSTAPDATITVGQPPSFVTGQSRYPEFWPTDTDTPCHDAHAVHWTNHAEQIHQEAEAYRGMNNRYGGYWYRVVDTTYRGHNCFELYSEYQICSALCAL